ncbi:von Willebrand factor type A domain-containing protein [Xylariaceae sp. FL1651]|nr:von Willebrand factor type A domain-containing protein [Xylariaceae sp. FL1651]
MNVFGAGIVWDPREPPPPQHSSSPYPLSLAAVNPEIYPSAEHQYCETNNAPPTRVNMFSRNVIREPSRNILPAASTFIDGRITGDIAEVIVKQLFWNEADIPIHQGSYTFALPNGCTVTSFSCRIGNDSVLKAKARPKSEANEAFQEAVAAHRSVALLEQNTPEIFTSLLGNIPANTRVKIEVTYVAILGHRFDSEKNTTTLIIPTYIANRYGQRPVNLQGADLKSTPGDLSIQIEILESEKICSIDSGSHEILVDRGIQSDQASKWDDIGRISPKVKQESAIVKLKNQSNWLDADFILSIETACPNGAKGPHAWLEVHPSFENHAAMMMTLPPRILLSQNETHHSGEILFLVDRSGSMEDKMENLKSAMHFFLKGIPLGRTFNIWSFGSSYQSLWAISQAYGDESLRIALNYVETNFHADMGGTELLGALEAIIVARHPTVSCDVVILTDGEVWRLDETLDLVDRAAKSSGGALRFFALGIGAHVSHALVEGIAKQGGGYSEVIPRASQGGWEDRVVAMLKAALTKHSSGLQLDIGNLRAVTSPTDLGSLNLFRANRIFLLLEQAVPENECIAVKAMLDGNQISFRIPITRLQKPGTVVHNLSARAILDDLERLSESSPLPHQFQVSRSFQGEGTTIRQLAENLACTYSLASKWTSLFLVQEENQVGGGELAIRYVTKIDTHHAEDKLLLLRNPPGGRGRPAGSGMCLDMSLNSNPFFLQPCPLASFSESDEPQSINPWHGQADWIVRHGHCVESIPKKRKPRGPKTKKVGQKKFILMILSHQIFNGSVTELPFQETLGHAISELKNWVHERTIIESFALELVANTAIAVALLERYFLDCKDLWVLMREKALGYISSQVPDVVLRDELFQAARKELCQVVAPVYLTPEYESGSYSGSDSETDGLQKRKEKTDKGKESERVEVQTAPID